MKNILISFLYIKQLSDDNSGDNFSPHKSSIVVKELDQISDILF